MARPTKSEQERKRIAALAAEGKDANGEPIQDATILEETNKNGTKSYVDELQEEVDRSTFSMKGDGEANKKQDKDLHSSDFREESDYAQPKNPLFSEPIIENESDGNMAGKGGPPPPTNFDEPVINIEPPMGDNQGASPTGNAGNIPPVNPEVNNMSASEQKEQTRLFAEAIVEAYAQYVPMIFTMICSIDMNKMKLYDREGKLRLSMEVITEDGGKKTVREVFSDFNDRVNKTFVITTDMKSALLAALIPVLERRGISPSPEMTLGIVVVSQLIGLTVASLSLNKEKTVNYINPMIQLRKEEQEQEMQDHMRRQTQPETVYTPPPPPQPEVKKDEKKVSYDEVINTINNPPTLVEKKEEKVQTVTIEDVTEEKK